MAILKADKIEPMLNSPASSRKFFKSPSLKSQLIGMGADLDPVNSTTNFMPAGSNAFLTQNASMKSNDLKSLRGRKASHAPQLPQLDYVNRQEEQSRYDKGQGKGKMAQSTKNIDQKHITLTGDPSVAQVGFADDNQHIGEDFAKMHMEASM